MKKVTIKSFIIIMAAVAVASCKPTLKVNSDFDRNVNFSAYKTYGMYYLLTSRNINQLNEERIWNSIRAEMTKKGYTEDNRHPDLLVNAVTILKDKKYLAATAHGYYRPYGVWGAPGNATVQEVGYKEGSLVIDVIDTKTNKLVWQGTGMAEIDKKPKNPESAINTAVGKILTSFPQVNSTVKN